MLSVLQRLNARQADAPFNPSVWTLTRGPTGQAKISFFLKTCLKRIFEMIKILQKIDYKNLVKKL